jgi:hypothetical protein
MSFGVFNVMWWRESGEKVGKFSQLNKVITFFIFPPAHSLLLNKKCFNIFLQHFYSFLHFTKYCNIIETNIFLINIFLLPTFFGNVTTFLTNVSFANYFLSTYCKMCNIFINAGTTFFPPSTSRRRAAYGGAGRGRIRRVAGHPRWRDRIRHAAGGRRAAGSGVRGHKGRGGALSASPRRWSPLESGWRQAGRGKEEKERVGYIRAWWLYVL